MFIELLIQIVCIVMLSQFLKVCQWCGKCCRSVVNVALYQANAVSSLGLFMGNAAL